MSDQTDSLVKLLEPFNLSTGEAQIYLALLENGSLSALQISRRIHMGRTKVYRLLDKLIAKDLVAQQTDEVGFKFLASPPEKFRQLLSQQQADITSLQQSLPQLITTLKQHTGSAHPGSKVLFYRGRSGLKQVNFNLLRAKKEFLSYETATAEVSIGHKDAEELRRQLVKRQITARNLMNVKKIAPFTKVTSMVRNYWSIRYTNPKSLAITADVFIYNNVYAMCHYYDHDVFCVEIYNQHLANMQRQIYELLWKQARPLTIINDQGEAILKSA